MPPKNPHPPRLDEIIGKSVLVGLTYVTHRNQIVEQVQFSGTFESMDQTIHIRRAQTGQDFTLPPDLNSFLRAAPGIYRLRSTGETVENPAFTTSWTIQAPAPKSATRKTKPRKKTKPAAAKSKTARKRRSS